MSEEHDYLIQQRRRDREYLSAWDALTPEQREEMRQAGVAGPLVEGEARGVGRSEDMAESNVFSYSVDMAASVDGLADHLREAYGLSAKQADGCAQFVVDRVAQAQKETLSLALARIVGFFLAGSENLQARAHGLAHAARMAGINGLRSLRHSAEICGVSPEWMRRVAHRWCAQLGLPEIEGAKSAEAKQAYSDDKKTNHWRNQKCKPGKQKTSPPQPKPQPSQVV